MHPVQPECEVVSIASISGDRGIPRPLAARWQNDPSGCSHCFTEVDDADKQLDGNPASFPDNDARVLRRRHTRTGWTQLQSHLEQQALFLFGLLCNAALAIGCRQWWIRR
ncbi:hypothetical protein BaRGS_00010492 [Batillaria attramentaria]|uniref:Uncharacterized protein n=1 Tax=Batillaria attramentaria TaxID=370345 RepID=A0ABD0LFY6_9CAEN